MEQGVTVPTMIEPPAHYPRVRTLEDVLEVKTVKEIQHTYHLYDRAAKTGLLIVAGPGAGKSRYMGRCLAWNLLNRQKPKPTVILDPTGGICDNLFDKIVRLPFALREEYCQQIQFIDAGSPDRIVPTPLFTRHSEKDSVDTIINRLLVVWQTLDPYQITAPVMGQSSIDECATYGGQIALALGLQLDFVADLVRYPKQYESLLAQVRRDYPQLKDAIHYFQELSRASRSEREHNTTAFLRKARMFLSDPAMRATFCAPHRGVDWQEVVGRGMTVVVDFRHEMDQRNRRFKLLWWLKDFMAFVKHRGMAGRDNEVTLIIDELSQLLGYQTLNGDSVLAQDIEELTTVFGRAYGVNVVIALQGLDMVDSTVRSALMRMGTLMVGRVANPEDALLLAKAFKTYDPTFVRKKEPVWMNVEKIGTHDRGSYKYHEPEIIDWRTTEFSTDEQYTLFADRLRSLSQFEFVLRPSVGEGQLSDELLTINVDEDPGEFPHEPYIAAFREYLQAGRPVDELLQEIDRRKPPMQAPVLKKDNKHKHPTQNGKIAGPHAGRNHSIPAAATTPTPSPTPDHLPLAPTAADEIGSEDDDVWQ